VSDNNNDNAAYLEKLKSIISINGGRRRCGDNIIQASNSQPAFTSNNRTQVKVATDAFDITNIDKTYMIQK
jgi:hypothetical protein